MTDPIVIFNGTTGLNTVNDPARLPDGDVAEIVNMRIDQSGRPSKRVGQTLLEDGSFHSLYDSKYECFVAKDRDNDTAIYQISNDGTLTGIRSGLTYQAKICFKAYGNKVYYCNGSEQGYLFEGSSNIWSVGDYFGPSTDRSFTVPDRLNHLEIHSGRMYSSVGSVLYWSEPFRFDLFDQVRNFISFHSNIRMVLSVAGGLFISTEWNTYFLTGNDPTKFTLVKIASFPALEWSACNEMVDGADIGFDPGLCGLWNSVEGAILGFPSGQILNLTKEKIIYPEDVTFGFSGLM